MNLYGIQFVSLRKFSGGALPFFILPACKPAFRMKQIVRSISPI